MYLCCRNVENSNVVIENRSTRISNRSEWRDEEREKERARRLIYNRHTLQKNIINKIT